MTRLRLAGLVAAVFALMPLAAAASDQDDALKLAARAASMGMEKSTVLLHAVPSDFPSSIPLPKATLLGSVASSPMTESYRGGMTVHGRSASLYYDAPGTRDAVARTYRDTLRAAGWADKNNFTPVQGGFSSDRPNFTYWCRAGDHPAGLLILTGGDPDALTVRVETDERSAKTACESMDQRFSEMFRKSPLPTFEGADGVTIASGGPTNDGTTTGARITSSLGLSAVFETFAKQLRSAGWTPKATAAAAGVQSQTFAKTVDGKAYVALLSVDALDATHYVALADVSTLAE
jgi:hypothetical protein